MHSHLLASHPPTLVHTLQPFIIHSGYMKRSSSEVQNCIYSLALLRSSAAKVICHGKESSIYFKIPTLLLAPLCVCEVWVYSKTSPSATEMVTPGSWQRSIKMHHHRQGQVESTMITYTHHTHPIHSCIHILRKYLKAYRS